MRLTSQFIAAVSALGAFVIAAPAEGQERSAMRHRVAGAVVSAGRAQTSSDSATAVMAVNRFHDALSTSDTTTVLSLLAPDVVILEAGDVETLAEYRRDHLGADMEFARAVSASHSLVSVVVHGDAAWVTSTSISRGRMKDRQINSAGAELVVLSRQDRRSAWRIRAIHWSSRRKS